MRVVQTVTAALLVSLNVFGGQLIHRIDYETGDFSEWRTCSECSFDGDNPRIVSSPVRKGKKAARFESTDKRTEGASERFLDREIDLWVGFSVYVEKWADDPGRADVAQFHGYQPSCSNNDPKIHIDIKNLAWGITINYWEGGTKKTIAKSGLKPVAKGKWTDLVANFKLTSSNNGYFNFWVDGEKVLSYSGQTSGDCPLGHYLKAGVYNAPAGAVAYNDAFTVMKNASYKEVDPGGSGPSGGDGDSSDTDSVLEAENADFDKGIRTEIAGYTGTGYVRMDDIGNYCEWTWSAAEAGLYDLKFRMAEMYSTTYTATILVNGSEVAKKSVSGSAWTYYTVSAPLNAGTNTIRVEMAEGETDMEFAVDHLVPVFVSGTTAARRGLTADAAHRAGRDDLLSVYDLQGRLVFSGARGQVAKWAGASPAMYLVRDSKPVDRLIGTGIR